MWQRSKNPTSSRAGGSGTSDVLIAEDHPGGARLFLEHDHKADKWSIHCEIDGVCSHTAAADSELEAQKKFHDMKRDLQEILESSESKPCYEQIRLFMDMY